MTKPDLSASIYYKFPELAAEWDYERNSPLTPQQVTQGSTKIVWWLCPHGHSYDMRVYSRTSGKQDCPICSNMRVLAGFNDLKTQKPELAADWDYERNGELLPSMILPSTDRVVWWKCPNGHSYDLRVSSRSNGKQGCPFCAGKRVLYGFNDLESQAPDLSKEWDYEKNEPLSPREITAKSNRAVWWKCPKSHSYRASVADRNRNDGKAVGCPYCARKKPIPGETDLQTVFPQIAREWDAQKNKITPADVMPFSMKKVWWICPNGHNYDMTIANRTAQNQGCPYCSNMRVLPGFNDLESLFPELANEWDTENNKFTPNQIIPGTHMSAHWVCVKCGHKWKAPVKERAYSSTGCPKCAFMFHTSFQEQALFFYISQIWPDAQNTFHADWLGAKEIDIFVPSAHLAIEFDGGNWHQDVKRDIEKTKLIQSNGNRLIRIREGNAPIIDDGSIQFFVSDSANETDLTKAIENTLSWIEHAFTLHSVPKVDLQQDRNQIQVMYKSTRASQSVASYAEMMLEWHPVKNMPLQPDCVPASSHDKYWWRCNKCGIEWQQSPHTKRRGKLGCISCISKERNAKRLSDKIASGTVRTVSMLPELMEEWDWQENTLLPPDMATYGSEKKAAWICKKCGNRFLMSIKARASQGQNCPRCGRIAGAQKRKKRQA